MYGPKVELLLLEDMKAIMFSMDASRAEEKQKSADC